MNAIRVVIADDHHVFREGLRALLAGRDDIVVVGEARDTSSAVSIVTSTTPDVVLMDLQMPGDGGIAATSEITKNVPGVRVLVLTMYSDPAFLRRAVRAGARGYLLKDAEPDDVFRAIVTVAGGQVYLGGSIAEAGLSLIGSSSHDARFPTLTARETEILDRMAQGLPNDAIAARLGLSMKTVQNHVSAVLYKLEARDRAHAVAIARNASS